MASVRLEWGSAEVEDAKLTVALDGELPNEWKQSFETTAKLLGGGEWGDVTLKKSGVQVSDVTPGSEDKLRHHLEAIVAQANAAQESRDHEEQQDGDDENGSEPTGPDAEMTERFKAFAEEGNASDDPEND